MDHTIIWWCWWNCREVNPLWFFPFCSPMNAKLSINPRFGTKLSDSQCYNDILGYGSHSGILETTWVCDKMCLFLQIPCPTSNFDFVNLRSALTLNCIRGRFHGTQHLVFWLSHFNAAIFRADNFCNCLNSSYASFGEKKNWGPPCRFRAN